MSRQDTPKPPRRRPAVKPPTQQPMQKPTKLGPSPRRPSAEPPRRSTPPSARPRTPLPPPEARTISLNGVTVPYQLRVSARARRIRFVIRPNSGLEVVTPRGVPTKRIEEGLRAKAQWILTTGARMAQQTAPSQAPLTTGSILPYLGRRLLLVVHLGAPVGRFRATITPLADQPTPPTPPTLPVTPAARLQPAATHGLTQGRLDLTALPAGVANGAGQPSRAANMPDGADSILTLTVADAAEATIRVALETWYRRQAQAIVADRLALWNQHYGFTYHRVTIKEQKTRWGSCSRQGNLNFNWRLLLAPLDILDYVLIHELSHLKEPNHAPRFWAVVAQACPAYNERRRWLRTHGHELRF